MYIRNYHYFMRILHASKVLINKTLGVTLEFYFC